LICSDYKEWKKYFTGLDPKKSKYDRAPMPKASCSRSDYMTVIRRHRKVASEDKCYIYGAFLKDSGILIGILDISIISRGWYEMANLGYQIGNCYWGKGYGKEMVEESFGFSKNDLKIHRLEAAINLDNKPSINLAKSLGMRKEGIKKGYIFENDKWIDHVIYVFLANPTSKI
jgi:RimJ/RimL family protein N-acetyltransferase